MISEMLKKQDDDMQFNKFHVYLDHKVPSLNDLLDTYDGVIFSGSLHDAHSNDRWIFLLRELVRDIHRHNKEKKGRKFKMIGICFGHQLIAHALNGGLVDRNNKKEWELGIKSITLENAFHSKVFTDHKYRNVKELKLIQVHQDAVWSIPDDAVLLGHSEFTENEIFSIGDTALCFQGHPEFSTLYLEQILAVKRQSSVDKKEIRSAVQSIVDWVPDNVLCAQMIVDFLKY